MLRKAFFKTLKSLSEVAAATLELIKKEQLRTQASLVYLTNRRAILSGSMEELARTEGRWSGNKSQFPSTSSCASVSVREGHALWTLAEMASPQRINAHAVW
jgi:hypothetical protein